MKANAYLRPAYMPSLEESRAAYEKRRAERYAWRRWYGLQRWKKLRAEQLAREPLCCRCLADGLMTPATVCDHIEPHRGDEVKFWSGPFQSLCKPHHDIEKAREEVEG